MAELKTEHFQAVLDALPAGVKVQMQMNPRKIFLAGGFIREIVLGNKPRDIDIFVGNEDEAKRLSAEYADDYPDKKFKPWKSEYAHNFTPDGEFPVQWVFAVRYDPNEEWAENHYRVIDSFDFSMSKATMWFQHEDWCTFCNDNFYEHVEKHQLVFEPSNLDKGNLRALKRVIKFAARGWKIDDENLTQIIQQFAPEKTHEQIREALNPLYGQKKQKKKILTVTGWDEEASLNLNPWRMGTATGRVRLTGVQRNNEYLGLGNASSGVFTTMPYSEWLHNNGSFSVDVGTNPASETAEPPTDNANNEQGQ